MFLTDSVTVERTITATPEAIFAVLADPSRHRDIDGSGTVRDSPEGSRHLALGDTFGMNMRAGLSYQMVNEVVELVPGRRIAWQARPALPALRRLIGGRIWRYELEPVDGGTRVQETWDIRQEVLPLLVAPLRGLTRVGITRSLDRLAKVVAG